MIFTSDQLSHINTLDAPKHVAFIPDGNRRWAKNQELLVKEGHEEGVGIIMNMVRGAKEIGIKVLTFYTFSTENWNRPAEEVDALMWLAELFLVQELPEMLKEGVRLRTIGNLNGLSERLRTVFEETIDKTKEGNKIDLILAINYGSRDEIARATRELAQKVKIGDIEPEAINEDMISKHLDTCGYPDPDLLIRTGGEFRLSNYLLWQISYAEVYISPLMWPDFTPSHLLEAVKTFQKRDRRQGH